MNFKAVSVKRRSFNLLSGGLCFFAFGDFFIGPGAAHYRKCPKKMAKAIENRLFLSHLLEKMPFEITRGSGGRRGCDSPWPMQVREML